MIIDYQVTLTARGVSAAHCIGVSQIGEAEKYLRLTLSRSKAVPEGELQLFLACGEKEMSFQAQKPVLIDLAELPCGIITLSAALRDAGGENRLFAIEPLFLKEVELTPCLATALQAINDRLVEVEGRLHAHVNGEEHKKYTIF